jgi:hypothetical protein
MAMRQHFLTTRHSTAETGSIRWYKNGDGEVADLYVTGAQTSQE